MSGDDVTYYRVRAESEHEQARLATHPEAAKAHSELERAYRERLGAAKAQRSTDNV